MYLIIVVLLVIVFPLISIFIEASFFKSTTGFVLLIGKWFVFWVVGIRLFLAGLRQAISPQFTAEQMSEIKTREPLIAVQELGFANLALGLLGLSALLRGDWVMPSAIAGGLFYGLVGLRHFLKKERNHQENTAMLADLLIFFILLFYIIWVITHP